MTVFGYKVEYSRLSYKDQLDYQESCILPSFGFGYWTFNNREWSKWVSFKEKQKVVVRNKGLYLHLWLFSYRFDLVFTKRFPV